MVDRQRRINERLRSMRELAAEISASIADMRELQLQISVETYYVATWITHCNDSQHTIECLHRIQRLSRKMLQSSDDTVTSQRHLRLEVAQLNNLLTPTLCDYCGKQSLTGHTVVQLDDRLYICMACHGASASH